MRSRYDLMEDSVVKIDGDPYKDIFTLPTQKFVYREPVVEATLEKGDIVRSDYLGIKMYGKEELEDIVLMLNALGLIQQKSPGDTIEVPAKTDIETFFYKYKL